MPHTQKLSSSDIFGFFRYFIKPYRTPIALMFVFFLATVVDRAFMPYLFSRIIDKIEQCTVDRELIFNSLVRDVAVIIAIYCVLEVCYRAKGFLEAKIIPKFQADIRIEANRRLQGYPLGFFFNNSIGSITAKINNLPHSAAEVCVEMIEVVVPVICTAIVSIIMLCSISLYIAGFFVIWFILHLAVTFFFTRKCTYYSNIHAESLSNLSGIITDSMRNIMNIKLFMRADYELSYIKKHQKVEADNNSRVIKHIEKTKIILGILTITEYAGALVIALLGWKNGQLSIGDIVFVFNISSNMLILAWWLTLECPFIFKHIGVVRQGLTIFDLPEKLQQEKGTKQLVVTKGAISFSNVNFGYSASKKIFDDLSIEITPGTKVGLVGFSGSGKSTFANLLQKFYLPDSGVIAIDGQDIRQINNESLMSNIAVVPQNVTLFQRTIAENIMCANVNADYEDMIKAAKQACCHDFIIKTEHGYDNVLSDVVTNLSGGQRQLIGIARAIIKNAPILILDEATSALDYITEMKIRNILDKLMEGKTAIIIAHRLSTLAKVDRILVFQNGKIVEDGTHQSLLAKNEHYAMLWNMHSNGFIV